MTTDNTTPVPTALIEALKDGDWYGNRPYAVAAIIACLPKPPPTFDDVVCAAFFEAFQVRAQGMPDSIAGVGRGCLTALYDTGWLTPTDDGSFVITPPKETS